MNMPTIAPPKRVKLSKKFLMEQEQGSYIVSNIFTDETTPMFAEEIGSPQNRQSQWERIKKAGISERLCHVFESKVDYQKWLSLHLIGEVRKYRKRYKEMRGE